MCYLPRGQRSSLTVTIMLSAVYCCVTSRPKRRALERHGSIGRSPGQCCLAELAPPAPWLSAGPGARGRLAHVAGGQPWLWKRLGSSAVPAASSRKPAWLPHVHFSTTPSKGRKAGASELVPRVASVSSDWSERVPGPAQIRGEGDRPLFSAGGVVKCDGWTSQRNTVSSSS